jgi:hypothetical protein
LRMIKNLLLTLLVLLLVSPQLAWAAADEANEKTQKAAVGAEQAADEGELGRGEGYEPKAEEAKEGVQCPATFGPIITDTAVPIDKGKFAVQPTFFMGFQTSVFNRSWRPVSAGGDFKSFQMTWKFVYGPIDNAEVSLTIPYINNWANNVNNPGQKGERSASYGGLGDIDLTLKYRLIEESRVLPTVTAMFATDFPTGHFKNLNPRLLGTDAIGGGTYIFTGGFNLSKCLNRFVLYGNFWYSMSTAFTTRGENEDGNAINIRKYPRDFVTVNLAAEYVITQRWIALLEFTNFWDGGRLIGRQANVQPQALMSLLPGIEYMATEKFALALGVNIDFAGKNYPANVSPVLSMVYQF